MPLTARDGLALASAALAAAALGFAAWLLIAGGGGPLPTSAATSPATGLPLSSGSALASPAASAGELLVDVQGGVQRPGLVRLPPGARVADAVEAAGGYSAEADLLAAASNINLAATLSDGAQVFVPLAGVALGPVPGSGAGAGGGNSDLVNLNLASPEALEALPGIGPVTVQKIVAARQERPFASLEELVERQVMNNGQLEQIRALVTL